MVKRRGERLRVGDGCSNPFIPSKRYSARRHSLHQCGWSCIPRQETIFYSFLLFHQQGILQARRHAASKLFSFWLSFLGPARVNTAGDHSGGSRDGSAWASIVLCQLDYRMAGEAGFCRENSHPVVAPSSKVFSASHHVGRPFVTAMKQFYWLIRGWLGVHRF